MKTDVLNESAVSPVVGVMLMLVVTIIIAAVVSAFSGGLSQTTSKAPQINIGAEVRDNAYIILEHKGGDSISGGTISVKSFIPAGMYKDMSTQVDLKKAIYLSDGQNVSTGYSAVVIQPGDKIRINWIDAFTPSSYGLMAPSVGEPVDIEVYDSSTGKAIATVRTNVLP
jgi:FlaG/FlaF family flagellin (archaellin)